MLVRVTLAFIWAVALTVHAQQPLAPSELDKSYQFAWNYLKLADATKSPDESASNLLRAIAQCDDIAKIDSGSFRPQGLAAHCYYRLAQLEHAPARRRDLVQVARERFDRAAHCPDVEPACLREWAEMLMAECDEPENAAQRQQLLGETRKVCELGLKLPGFTGERARLRRGLGTSLVLLAQSANEEAAKRGLYQEAICQFASAGEVESMANTPRLYTHWGVALLEYGKLTNDRQVLWQSVERLLTALENDPHNLEARYNLVCVYALMNEPDKAMRNLHICLESDDAGRTYYQAAARDPDLDSLRHTAAYNEIFGEKTPSSADTLNKPTISNQ